MFSERAPYASCVVLAVKYTGGGRRNSVYNGYNSISPDNMRNSLGIGDTDIFDWDGVLSALIRTIIVLMIATLVFRRTSSRPSLYPLPWRQASGHDLSHTTIGGGI